MQNEIREKRTDIFIDWFSFTKQKLLLIIPRPHLKHRNENMNGVNFIKDTAVDYMTTEYNLKMKYVRQFQLQDILFY